MKRTFGWRPDLPDHRDFSYVPRVARVPQKTDVSALIPKMFDQGPIGSCVGNSTSKSLQFVAAKKAGKPVAANPSRLFIYYNARAMEGTVDQDAGCYIRDAIKSVVKIGAPNESLWPYDVSKFATKPPASAYKAGLDAQVLEYRRINNASLIDIKSCLAEGFPFIFGFTVYESFMKIGKDGLMPMPKKSERVLGGHAVLGVGHDDNKEGVKVANSWGADWGSKGYFWMPYSYITNPNLADDFWTIRKVE